MKAILSRLPGENWCRRTNSPNCIPLQEENRMSSRTIATVRDVVEPQDPRERYPKPPFPQEEQGGSGSAQRLDPPADYGEQSYQGHGRLMGRTALITGADSGIGRAVALCFAKE